jgi:hypothetical protein
MSVQLFTDLEPGLSLFEDHPAPVGFVFEPAK